jgi:hypothetical protein
MSDIVDLSARRFAAAADTTDTRPIDALREALRRVEQGELDPSNVIVTCLLDEGNEDSVQCIHGGPASCNERIGMLYRAQAMLLPSNLGGNQ